MIWVSETRKMIAIRVAWISWGRCSGYAADWSFETCVLFFETCAVFWNLRFLLRVRAILLEEREERYLHDVCEITTSNSTDVVIGRWCEMRCGKFHLPNGGLRVFMTAGVHVRLGTLRGDARHTIRVFHPTGCSGS